MLSRQMELTDAQAGVISKAVDLLRFAVQWGFVPMTLYLGKFCYGGFVRFCCTFQRTDVEL